MTFVIPANCQVRIGGHTITFNCEQRGSDPLRASSVVEMNGEPARADMPIPPVLMRELRAMVHGR